MIKQKKILWLLIVLKCTKFSGKNMNKKVKESPHPLKNFRPLEKGNKSVADKKAPVSKLSYERTQKQLPTANCVIVIDTKLVIAVSIQILRPEKLVAENWIFAFYVRAHDRKEKAVQEILISFTFYVTKVKLIDVSLPYTSTKQRKIIPLPFRRYTPIWNYQTNHIICL